MPQSVVQLNVSQREKHVGSFLLAQPGEYVIGRDPSCSIVLDDGEISARHARLVLDAAQLLLEDLGSANGTFVDGETERRGTAQGQ